MLFCRYRYFLMVVLMLAVACAQQPKPVKKPATIAKAKTPAAPAKTDSVKKVIIREPDLRA